MSIQQHTIDTPYMVGPVHCYSTVIDGELILFDTGPPTPACQRYLCENLDLAKLKYVFITHCHIDHYGMAHWLEQETDAAIFLPYRDGLKLLSHYERLQDMYTLLASLGFDGDFLNSLHNSLSDGKVFPPFPKKFRIIEDEMPEHLGISYMSCPGHSQSDLVFYTDEWAVTGDVLLRGVFQSPLLDANLETGERFNNYRAYCSSLIKLSRLEGRNICPGHRVKVDSVHETLIFYVSKMLTRVAQLSGIEVNRPVAHIIEELFGGALKDSFHIYLKASEIVFMQDFLDNPELLKRSLVDAGIYEKISDAYHAAIGAEVITHD